MKRYAQPWPELAGATKFELASIAIIIIRLLLGGVPIVKEFVMG